MKVLYFAAYLPLLAAPVFAQSTPRPTTDELVLGACAHAVQTYVAQHFANPTARNCFDKQLSTLENLKSVGVKFDSKLYATSIETKGKGPSNVGNYTINLASPNSKMNFFRLPMKGSDKFQTYISITNSSNYSAADKFAMEYLRYCFYAVQDVTGYEPDLFKEQSSCEDSKLDDFKGNFVLKNRGLVSEIRSLSITSSNVFDIYRVVNVRSQSGRWFSMSLYADSNFMLFRYPILAPDRAKLSW